MTSLTTYPVREIPDSGQGELTRYIGLATRLLAFVVDAAVITAVAIVVGLGAALIQGVLHLPSDVQKVLLAIGAGAYVLGTIGYFVGFWAATGQTPGCRVTQIRVRTSKGDRVTPRRGLVRCVGVILAALPLFLGFLPIVFDRRRRGFQDWLAGTVVVDAPEVSFAQSRRLRRRATYQSTGRDST